MEKPKRFSFAGLTRSFSFSAPTKPTLPPTATATATTTTPPSNTVADSDEDRRRRRTHKSQSLYVKSFRHLVGKDDKAANGKTFDASEATQKNSKEIRNTIRRSLSAVVYASPISSSDPSNTGPGVMVPVLVTPEMSDAHGGLVMDEPQPIEEKPKRKKKVEYDNSLVVMSEEDEEKKKKTMMIVWQGYGYTVDLEGDVAKGLLGPEEQRTGQTAQESLEKRFEQGIWNDYRGLIHPLHLFEPAEQGNNNNNSSSSNDDDDRNNSNNNDDSNSSNNDDKRWAGLSVTELRRYYDNYGSMMLKIRESRMVEQQRHYHVLEKQGKVEKDWIIPKISEAEVVQEIQVAA
ncbi:hypothetical protein DFQ28_002873 [Apophysomyces sp. BC1034]|nr:hypothetical protein DFQ30_005489 [Apophysomyces sp. BC1015]KAG0179135.1 hypothetical protein DFQ29_002471 [Apophysomyces sp. BC1021]KAG0189798.1 hypothetical protein DFQ28_002873 [Apophysomyces sp. BC1034]